MFATVTLQPSSLVYVEYERRVVITVLVDIVGCFQILGMIGVSRDWEGASGCYKAVVGDAV